MRSGLPLLLMLACFACEKSETERVGDARSSEPAGGTVVTLESPDLRERADSLAGLNPATEAAAAARRSDFRYLAKCTVRCVPIGLPGDSICLASGCLNPADVRVIAGAFSAGNADGARLDSVATRYGAQYNRKMREYRKHRPRPHANV